MDYREFLHQLKCLYNVKGILDDQLVDIRAVNFEAMIIQALLTLVSLALMIYLKGVRNERYWKKRGVVFHNRNKVLGVAWDCLTQNRAYFEHFDDIYREYPAEPAVGIGSVLKPAIFLRDVTNIQHVMSTDFDAFNHKGIETIEEDVLANNLFILNGGKWKVVRQKMSPLFTSCKLRGMFEVIDKSAQDIVQYIKSSPHLKANTFHTLSTFCSAAMSAVIFGTSESIIDSPFLKIAQKVSKPSFWFYFKFVVSLSTPRLMRVFKIKIFSEFQDFFVGATKKLLRSRENGHIKWHDFADVCLSLKMNGNLKDDTGLEVEPTDELLAAQGFVFFIAGVEPTAVTIYNTLILLGQNKDVLERLHNEIDKAFEQNDGKMTYEVISEMKYLDMVFTEASRIYPAIGYYVRQCVRDSVLPVGNIKIEKGTTVFMPAFSLHHDEKYFPDPEVFDPERFSRENKVQNNRKLLLHFGKGKRICIGMRFAILQAKAGIVHLLRNFTVKTRALEDRVKYKKDQLQVRPNIDVEFTDRKL